MVSFRLLATKDCHCESHVARDEAIYSIAKVEINRGTVPADAGLPVIPNRQAGSLSLRSLAMTQDKQFPA